jgi:ABC-2 type transport system ATP-binding protein
MDVVQTQPVAAVRPASGNGHSQPPAPPPVAAVIEARALTKTFGDQAAVENLTFSVPPGIILGLIGPSGCGKTTTVRLMTGIYLPTSGQIMVLGKPPSKFSASTRRRLGYMPQHFVLYPNLSVWENINFSASLYGMGFSRTERLKQLLDFVELYPHRHKLARSISGGMQRRLALATTLAHDPTLIFLDEPTAGIDPVLRRKFWEYFQALKGRGRTLVVTTQYVGEATYCDYVAVMAAGHILVVDTPDGLRRRAFGGELVDLQAAKPIDEATLQALRSLPYIGPIQFRSATALRMIVSDAGTVVPALLEWARARRLQIQAVEKYVPPLDDAFVELVKGAPSAD